MPRLGPDADPDPAPGPPRARALGRSAHRVGRVVVPAAVGVVVAVVTALWLFGVSSREVTVASHDAVVRPSLVGDLRGDLVLRTGPVLPDLRLPGATPVGVEVELGKTEARSTAELLQRYAFIASQPEPQRAVVVGAVQDMAVSAALRGAAAGVAVVGVWLLVGSRRRREVVAALRRPRGAVVAVVVVAVVVAAWQPWVGPAPAQEAQEWEPLGDFLGSGVPLPPEAADLQVSVSGVTSVGTRRLVRSAVDTYDRSRAFYADAVEAAGALVDDPALRQPEEGETVALLVSDRHDNVGMDPVARAVADAAGATAVLDAGDDTSTGSRWEAFSLDSLQESFGDLDRWAVTGNHDNGPFVGERLAELGWTVLDGEVVEGPGGSRLLGVGDPRASGLGTWRDETGLSFSEQAERLADAACEADAAGERVATLLVHDANSGRPALERGCVDLVVGGHLHVPVGPTAVVGAGPAAGEETGEETGDEAGDETGDEAGGARTGWTYTNGTTGGAAYAIAVGSKLRRSADVALLTYRDGRPVGVQGVTLQTNGVFVVGEWTPLTYAGEVADAGSDGGVPGRSEAPEPAQQVGPGTVVRRS